MSERPFDETFGSGSLGASDAAWKFKWSHPVRLRLLLKRMRAQFSEALRPVKSIFLKLEIAV